MKDRIYNIKEMMMSDEVSAQKAVLWYVHVCYQLNEQTFEA